MAAAVSHSQAWYGLDVISRGLHRVCTRDPHDPWRCLKFELPPAERPPAGLRQSLHRCLAEHMPALGDNRTELRAYRRLHARLGEAVEGHLVACHGILDTPYGPALQCDCLLTNTGRPEPSLHSCLSAGRRYAASELCAAVDAFEGWLLRHDVPLFDLNAGNFVVHAADGRVRLLCVDTKSVVSSKELLPYSHWSRRLMHRKLARRAQRLRDLIRASVPG